MVIRREAALLVKRLRGLFGWFLCSFTFLLCHPVVAQAVQEGGPIPSDGRPWWFWPLVLFFFCLVLGVFAVLAGVGGGVLYVPLVSGLFPFHLDFVRGAGLLVASRAPLRWRRL